MFCRRLNQDMPVLLLIGKCDDCSEKECIVYQTFDGRTVHTCTEKKLIVGDHDTDDVLFCKIYDKPCDDVITCPLRLREQKKNAEIKNG